MNIRERIEQQEEKNLSKFATLSSKTLGREKEEEKCFTPTLFKTSA